MIGETKIKSKKDFDYLKAGEVVEAIVSVDYTNIGFGCDKYNEELLNPYFTVIIPESEITLRHRVRILPSTYYEYFEKYEDYNFDIRIIERNYLNLKLNLPELNPYTMYDGDTFDYLCVNFAGKNYHFIGKDCHTLPYNRRFIEGISDYDIEKYFINIDDLRYEKLKELYE